ncbi:hypothetical protein ACH6XI_28930, partial [Klebsiella pneumoniae]|nr:hypothetical protein [Klebsiella pneumoniae]
MTVFLMAVFFGLLKTGSLIALLVDAYKGWTLFWKNYDRHCCKVSDEAAFCLIQRPYISKTLLTRRISP